MKSILIDNDDQLFPVELRMADLKDYFSIIMEAFDKKDDHLKDIKPEQSEQFDSWLNARMTYSVYFKMSFRYAFVVQLYSIIEFELKSVCRYLEGFLSLGKTMDKVKCSSPMEKAEKYFEDHIGLNLESIDGFSAIKTLRRIRNVITHSNGYFSKKDPNYEAIEYFSQLRPDLLELHEESDQLFLIELKDKFIVDFFLKELEKFLLGLSEYIRDNVEKKRK